MSTPTTPDGPPDEPAREPDAMPTEQHPTAAGPAAAAPPPPAGPPPFHPGYPPYQPYPFAPRVREPWINPAKRGAITAVTIVLALVLLGGGIVIGAVAGHDDGRSGRGFVGPLGTHQGPGSGGHRDFQQPGTGRRPGFGPGNLPTTAPSPTPSTSHS